MLKYCIKRILLSLLILFGVSVILYVLVRTMPMSYFENLVANNVAGGSSNIDFEQRVEEMKAYYGLDGSIIQGYIGWLKNFIRGDLGMSYVEGKPVEQVIFEDMGVSFSISFVSLILQLVIAIPLGIKCACNQYGKLDYAVTVLTMIGISFPTFFFGSIVIKFFALDLGWFPVSGLPAEMPNSITDWSRLLDLLWHLVLPISVLVILSIGSLMRYTRTNTLEILTADYIRTARAKGLSENKVVYKHVFRNTMIPLLTTLAGILPGLFGGAMITEQVFDIPGIGQTAYKLMQSGDIPFIMGYNMFVAVLTVIGILLTDIMYAVVDPRVKLGD